MKLDPKLIAHAIIKRFPLFGDSNSENNWKMHKRIRDTHHENRFTIVFKQMKNEVPTFSGEIKVHFTLVKKVIPKVLSLDCYIYPRLGELSTEENILPEEALEIAHDWAAKKGEHEVNVFEAEKLIYRYNSSNSLVWKVKVHSKSSNEFRYTLFIDAISGVVINDVSLIRHAIYREAWYGYYQSTPEPYWVEGNAFPTPNKEANNMISMAGYVYEMMYNAFNIRSFDQQDGGMYL